MVKVKEEIIRYTLLGIVLIGILFLGYYLEKNPPQTNLAGKAYQYDDFGAVPQDAKGKSIPARKLREQAYQETSPEEEFYMKQCLTLGCYDTDDEDSTIFGKVYLRKQKAGGKQYCVSSDDSCKKYEGKWYVIEQTCKEQDADKGYFITQQIPKLCEGVCDQGKCMPPTCNDGIKNQDEEQVDCGGPCDKCVSESCKDQTGVTPLVKDSVIVKDVNSNDLPIYDSCVDNNENSVEESTMLFERTCKDNSINKEKIHCKCKDGACEKAWCIDDDEKDIHNKDTVVGISSGQQYGDPLTLQDTCSYGSGTGESESGSHVIELFCNKEDYLSYGDFIKCPQGEWCFDGACQKVTCKDTDGGDKPFVYGTAKGIDSDNYETRNDECVKGSELYTTVPDVINMATENGKYLGQINPDGYYLKEVMCQNNDEYIYYGYYECPNSCQNGACNEEMICIDSDGKDIYIRGKNTLNPKSNPKKYGSSNEYCSNKNNPGFYLLNTAVHEEYCKTPHIAESEIINCNSEEICNDGKCQLKTDLFCFTKDEQGNMNKVYYLEGDTCYNCLGPSFIISNGFYTTLYKAFVNSFNNNQLIITFNDNTKPGAIGLDIKTFPFNDGKETVFEYNGIKFTLVIDTKKKSIFFKDLGESPPELQNIQCPMIAPIISQVGAIVQNMQCIDTDAKGLYQDTEKDTKNIFVQGKAGILIPTDTDSCSKTQNGLETSKGKFVVERFCRDNQVKKEWISCIGTGYCKGGKCQANCQEIGDNGYDFSKQGTVTDLITGEQKTDFCSDYLGNQVKTGNKIVEFYCKNEGFDSESLPCPSNMICQNGACVKN